MLTSRSKVSLVLGFEYTLSDSYSLVSIVSLVFSPTYFELIGKQQKLW